MRAVDRVLVAAIRCVLPEIIDDLTGRRSFSPPERRCAVAAGPRRAPQRPRAPSADGTIGDLVPAW